MTLHNTYRVDLVTKLAPSKLLKDYHVPCGMNSILATSHKPITQQSWSIPDGMVALYSIWSPMKRDYINQRIVG
jgi:hypothetical protein